MKKLGYVLVIIGIIALLDGCHIGGGRHTVIVENGNGKERRIEYRGYAYFKSDSSAISRISPNGTVIYKTDDVDIKAESDHAGNITYQFNGGEKHTDLDKDEQLSLARAVRDMMKVGHSNK